MSLQFIKTDISFIIKTKLILNYLFITGLQTFLEKINQEN